MELDAVGEAHAETVDEEIRAVVREVDVGVALIVRVAGGFAVGDWRDDAICVDQRRVLAPRVGHLTVHKVRVLKRRPFAAFS